MRFLLDMGVSRMIQLWLGSQEHDAVHLRELGLKRISDEEIFEKAAIENRIIMTWDLDFGEILALSRGRIVSVVLFRLNNASSSFVIERLSVVLPATEAALNAGAIVVVEDSRHRVRRLPLGS
jgi:predicted nuclease of predicted toxin-antitoxin system